MIRQLICLFFLLIIISCQDNTISLTKNIPQTVKPLKIIPPLPDKETDSICIYQNLLVDIDNKQEFISVIKDNDFVNVKNISSHFILDMKYATSDNFLNEIVYPCAQCYVRKEVAKALISAYRDFLEQGYRIKFFDCYRPYSVQKKMWKIFPNPGYVADPKGGSIHNRGAALDITLTDIYGNEIDMGTDFDYFGRESHHSYLRLSDTVILNRKLLRNVMEKNGFKSIRTEWWHYNYTGIRKFNVSDFRWNCD